MEYSADYYVALDLKRDATDSQIKQASGQDGEHGGAVEID
jgi:hypothetical protein